MCFRSYIVFAYVALTLVSCTPYSRVRTIRSGEMKLGLSVKEDAEDEPVEEGFVEDPTAVEVEDGPIIMNAIRDSETGEMVATDVISASKVTARFRNVAERGGLVTVGFDISVPRAMIDSRWQMKIFPVMTVMADTVGLEPLFITGEAYRNSQLRGYQRYKAFIASIITDTTDLVHVRQLEVFLERNFPDTYSMKTDSSLISRPQEENLFGVTQMDALRHYTRKWKHRRNEWKKQNKDKVFSRFVRDPFPGEGVRLDTVVTSDGDFVYQYSHTFRSRPGLKKVRMNLRSEIFQDGRSLVSVPMPQDLTFYISSLSSLADTSVRYVMRVVERAVSDHTKALIDFEKGSAAVDTLKDDNAAELARIRRCIADVAAQEDLILDSLVIVASCSPEGSLEFNKRLSQARSSAVMKIVRQSVPDSWKGCLRTGVMAEDWERLETLVRCDSSLSSYDKNRLRGMFTDGSDPDLRERQMSGMACYRYLREKLYPQLRAVSLDFYLHRKGMQKDTVHTSVVDTVYMSGLAALKNMDYPKAVERLRPYSDYNCAVAFVTAGYNASALAVLEELDDTPKVLYLKSVALSRLERYREALQCYESAVEAEPSIRFRANLDPEMNELIRRSKRL